VQVDVLAAGLGMAVGADHVGIPKHLEHRQVDESRNVLKVCVVHGLLERAYGRVDVAIGLVLVKGELGPRVVKLRVVRQRLLEVSFRLLVVVASLVGETRVVSGLG